MRSVEASPRTSTSSVDFSRIVAFTDGIFAIAITLLVLNFDVPQAPGGQPVELDVYAETLGGDVLAYFLTFAVVGRLWLVHHRLFGTLESFDSRLMVLNLAYLAMIALMPFPAELLGEYGDQRLPVLLYASVLAAAAALNWIMARHAVHAGLVHADHREVTAPWGGRRYAFIPAVFLLSIPMALVSPLGAQLMWTAVIVARVVAALVDRRSV
jgi:uncharacterized membrane protein